MGFFDKKYCSICGEKIGLLGNRKLEDGNLCKDCAKKLSPWFSERRNSTVQEIKEQLDWREANRERTAQFRTTRSFGERTKLLLDETHCWFTVTRAKSPADGNSDVLDFSAITGCRAENDARRTELKIEMKDSDGKTVRKSYNPPRYEYDYDFYIIISVNVPYFNEMKFKLNDSPVHIPFQSAGMRWPGGGFLQNQSNEPLYDPCYRSYKETCDEICNLMKHIQNSSVQGQKNTVPDQGDNDMSGIHIPEMDASPAAQKAVANAIKNLDWRCSSCHLPNFGTTICRNCGAPLSDEHALSVLKDIAYAATLEDGATPGNTAAQNWSCSCCGAVNQGKFCESCGAKKP